MKICITHPSDHCGIQNQTGAPKGSVRASATLASTTLYAAVTEAFLMCVCCNEPARLVGSGSRLSRAAAKPRKVMVRGLHYPTRGWFIDTRHSPAVCRGRAVSLHVCWSPHAGGGGLQRLALTRPAGLHALM